MNTIKFRVAAKTDVGLVRTNNEDNFQVASDLSLPYMHWVNNEICSLGDRGALLVVADGMGGMNAGEVASALAMETVKSFFRPERLTHEVMKTRFSIEKFMNEAIVAADARIKQEGRARPETRGMGTTIVLAWLLGQRLYVSWCGDSRAYVYNPATGLHQITKDHSYVQGLVDKGIISRYDAFDYPESNIITRSLCDAGPKAKPESLLKPYDVCDGDIILLCTDGLSGMIRDHEMEQVLRQNEHDMTACADALIGAACAAAGADNVTVCLCQVLQGGGAPRPEAFIETEARLNGPQPAAPGGPLPPAPRADAAGRNRRRRLLAVLLAAVLFVLLCAGGAGYYFFLRPTGEEPAAKDSVASRRDSVPAAPLPPEPGMPSAPTESGTSAPAAAPGRPAGGGKGGVLEDVFGGSRPADGDQAKAPAKQPGQPAGGAKPGGTNPAGNGNKPRQDGANPPAGQNGGGQNGGAGKANDGNAKKPEDKKDKGGENNPESAPSSKELEQSGGGNFA